MIAFILLHDTDSEGNEREVLVNAAHIDYMRPVRTRNEPRTLISFNCLKDGQQGEPKEKVLYIQETIQEIMAILVNNGAPPCRATPSRSFKTIPTRN